MIKLFRHAVFLLPLAALTALGQTSIDTNPQWNGTQFISSFGVTNTATYGQTVTVSGSNAVLTGFSFQIGNCTAQVNFRGHVYAWSGSGATGPSLFDGPVQSVSAGSTFTQVTVATGSITLAPGAYVLFVSTSEDQAGAASCRFGAVPAASYPGGDFVFINNGPNPAQWTSGTWTTFSSIDLAFTANFQSAVPTLTQSGMILLACGFIAIAARKLLPRDSVGSASA